ncbi:MAG: hypothetical protein ACW99F_08175 [Candidatus Hodarchaeales archaeon]|jgi:hypothetical protein
MTLQEWHDTADLLIDKANAPYFNTEEKDRFFNLAHIEFVETRYAEFEFNEKRRKELIPLVRRYTTINGDTINLDNITDFLYILNLTGMFDNGCGGEITMRVSPIKLDDEGESQNDPFNRHDNFNPGYTEENDGSNNVAIIVSDTPPSSIVLKYLKRPVNVSLDEAVPANTVESEMPISTHEEIINIAVRKMLFTVQDQVAYQFQNNEINNQE